MDRLPKAIFCDAVEGQMRRGHPKTRWRDYIDNEMGTMGLTQGEWIHPLLEHVKWKGSVEQTLCQQLSK